MKTKYYWSAHNWITFFLGLNYWLFTLEFLRKPFKEWKFRFDVLGWLKPIPYREK